MEEKDKPIPPIKERKVKSIRLMEPGDPEIDRIDRFVTGEDDDVNSDATCVEYPKETWAEIRQCHLCCPTKVYERFELFASGAKYRDENHPSVHSTFAAACIRRAKDWTRDVDFSRIVLVESHLTEKDIKMILDDNFYIYTIYQQMMSWVKYLDSTTRLASGG